MHAFQKCYLSIQSFMNYLKGWPAVYALRDPLGVKFLMLILLAKEEQGLGNRPALLLNSHP